MKGFTMTTNSKDAEKLLRLTGDVEKDGSLAQALMEVTGYNQRYSHSAEMMGEVERCTAEVAAYTPPFNMNEPLTVAKGCDAARAIACLRYQCAEGDVPETDLFKALTLIEQKLCVVIVGLLPEYERALWD
jgi:hypothetical protein